ncbi:MAG: hypothetical protein U5L74_07960 [Ideonella sp.]|nr:hypothetical protein [Ideonella sp.]
MKHHGIVPALLSAALLSAGLMLSTASFADSRPKAGVVNYETAQVHPVDLTPDKNTLLVVNTAANALEVFDVNTGLRRTIPVGLDPVSVRARTNSEVWVVNQLSDSISIVDLQTGRVTTTLKTDNEPADVVFAAGKAYVSCSDTNTVMIFTLSNLALSPRKLLVVGEEPRALAVNASGSEVYVAIFESGNGTTALDGRATVDANGVQKPLPRNVVNRPEGPWKGVNPPPNAGNGFKPALPPGLKPYPVGLIVRQDDAGRWKDDNNGDWTRLVSGDLARLSSRIVGWKLADNDVAIIGTANDSVIGYKSRLMNINMALDVNPVTGQVAVVGTDAINQVRYEPNLSGKFVQMKMARFLPSGAAGLTDLNPHLSYQAANIPAAQRSLSLGDPRGIKWRADGQSAWVTGMGSDNVIIVDANGGRLGQISVGEGPTGLALDETRSRAYVLNRFSASISVIDLQSRVEQMRVPFFDPTPEVVKKGRPLLYSTKFSGTGHTSCASCHVDAKTDRLAWDLGDPTGKFISVKDIDINAGLPTGTPVQVHPMKGPMLTQTFQDIMSFKSLHWRGDKKTLAEFADVYVLLMGADAAPTTAQMTDFGNFLSTVHLPPNPYRNMDDSRKTTVTLPDLRSFTANSSAKLLELRGQGTGGRVNCLQCHLQQGKAPRNDGTARLQGQSFVPPAFAPFYKRVGFWPNDPNHTSTSGFGFQHDGAEHMDLAVTANTGTTFQQAALAELLSLEGPTSGLIGGEKRLDTHAGVGTQLMLTGPITATQTTQLNQMISIAASSPHASMIFRRVQNGVQKGGYLVRGSQTNFQGNTLLEQLTRTSLTNDAAAGTPVVFTLVARGAEHRYGVDADADGILDGEEAAAGTDPRDATTPVSITPCASERSTCGFSGTQVVRFGNPTAGYSMGVFTSKVSCSTTAFNDPGVGGGTRRCEVVRRR